MVWGSFGLVDTRKPKLFHLVFNALGDCHGIAANARSLAAAGRRKPAVIAMAVPGSVGGWVLSNQAT